MPNLLVKGGPSHERPSEAWAPRSPHNDGLCLAVPTAHLFLNLLQLSLTLNFTSIQQRRIAIAAFSLSKSENFDLQYDMRPPAPAVRCRI